MFRYLWMNARKGIKQVQVLRFGRRKLILDINLNGEGRRFGLSGSTPAMERSASSLYRARWWAIPDHHLSSLKIL
jgi:hypothetical protein